MTHRALEVLQAVEAAIPGAQLQPTWRPDQTATVIAMGELKPNGDELAPQTFSVAEYRLTVAIDLYLYELEANWLDAMYSMLSTAHRAVMNDGAGGTYAALPYVVGAWIGDTGEPELNTDTERSHAYLRAEFFVDFRSDPFDPEN